MNDTEIQLLTLLNSYGDVVELDWQFDADNIISDLKKLEWENGPNGKSGLNLTGPAQGLDLEHQKKHDAFQIPNDNLKSCTGLEPFFSKWEKLARCRAVELHAGSFFGMHRDAHKMRPQMRIFIPLNKTEVHEWNFIYNTELYKFKPGKAYILNTRKQHGSFAMTSGIYHILMSVYLTETNLKTVMNMLPNCKEY
jgi:hypothetical protein